MPNNNNKFNMLKEIFEQPDIIDSIVKTHIDFQHNKVRFESFKDIVKELEDVKHILLVGCGTSFHAAIYGQYVIEELVGLNCEVEFADEFKLRNAVIEKHTAVIALSQSGETTDVINSVSIARKKGALVISVTNGIGSMLSKISDATIYNCAGREKALAATKTFTSQLVILLLISMYLSQMHKRSLSRVRELIDEIRTISRKIKKTLELDAVIRVMAKDLKNEKSMVVLGEKYNYPIALEGGLKLKETTYIKAEGFAGGEFRHGPLAIINSGFPCIVIAPNDTVYENNLGLMKDVKGAGAKIIALVTKTDKKLKDRTDEVLLLPGASELFMPILSVLPIQLFAFYTARAKGIDVDTPRNLNKFVKSDE